MAAWTPVTRALRGPVANWAHSRCSINILTDFCHFSVVTARQPKERECRWVTDGGTETEPRSPKTSPSALPQTPPTLGLTYLASSLSTPTPPSWQQPGPCGQCLSWPPGLHGALQVRRPTERPKASWKQHSPPTVPLTLCHTPCFIFFMALITIYKYLFVF